MKRDRQRLLEAILFFSSKEGVRHPLKLMMYKLLAQFEFTHFKQTGMPVIGLEFLAYPKGPVPEEFHKEITYGDEFVVPQDFSESLHVEKIEYQDEDGKRWVGFKYVPKRRPNLKIFSPRQQDILRQVADIYKETLAPEASKASHEFGTPWYITVKNKGKGTAIDLIETIPLESPLTKEIAKERLRERKALIHNLGG